MEEEDTIYAVMFVDGDEALGAKAGTLEFHNSDMTEAVIMFEMWCKQFHDRRMQLVAIDRMGKTPVRFYPISEIVVWDELIVEHGH